MARPHDKAHAHALLAAALTAGIAAAACSERTTPATAPEATSDPAVETSRPQSQQTTPQGEAPAETRPRS